jgi:hypothetical protein
MTFPSVAGPAPLLALALVLEPESAIATPPTATAIAAAPAAMDLVSVRLLHFVGLRGAMVLHPLGWDLWVDRTVRPAPWPAV